MAERPVADQLIYDSVLTHRHNVINILKTIINSDSTSLSRKSIRNIPIAILVESQLQIHGLIMRQEY